MNKNIELIHALAEHRTKVEAIWDEKQTRAVYEREQKWSPVLNVLEDFADEYPENIEVLNVHDPEEDIRVVLKHRNTASRYLLSDKWNGHPCIQKRRRGYPIHATVENVADLVPNVLSLLAEHIRTMGESINNNN